MPRKTLKSGRVARPKKTRRSRKTAKKTKTQKRALKKGGMFGFFGDKECTEEEVVSGVCTVNPKVLEAKAQAPSPVPDNVRRAVRRTLKAVPRSSFVPKGSTKAVSAAPAAPAAPKAQSMGMFKFINKANAMASSKVKPGSY